MSDTPIKTRFAPSPTGYIHLGNARTALFSALLAQHAQGTFLLRIEDTDLERSRDEYTQALQTDLRWLGLDWQEGPEVGGPHGPYHQSQRSAVYDQYYEQLQQAGRAYPCFCSSEELELARKVQRSAGRPPRYSGKCARLTPSEVEQRLAEGQRPTLRFRVADDIRIEFDDLVRGPQGFRGVDIGDFIIRRGDGTPAFFFTNAVDDALMGVTHVLRGEDHLTNTPRQLLLLQALGLPQPQYGHITMIVGADGSPLSKRHGSRSLRELRDSGYFPLAVTNYLARLGHNYENDGFMALDELAAGFEFARLGKSPARYDAHQLLHWQQQAIARASDGELRAWMGPALAQVPEGQQEEFIELIRPNVSFPEQAAHWAVVAFGGPLNLSDEAREQLAEVDSSFFREALAALDEHPDDFKLFADAVKQRSGAKGKALFMPLRIALTGETGGPEMARLFTLLGPARARQRLAACID